MYSQSPFPPHPLLLNPLQSGFYVKCSPEIFFMKLTANFSVDTQAMDTLQFISYLPLHSIQHEWCSLKLSPLIIFMVLISPVFLLSLFISSQSLLLIFVPPGIPKVLVFFTLSVLSHLPFPVYFLTPGETVCSNSVWLFSLVLPASARSVAVPASR